MPGWIAGLVFAGSPADRDGDVSEQESSPATAQAEAVEELLRQLVDARFVLTDRDGAVTRWTRPAEELFGWPSSRMLGRTLVDTLALTGDLPEFGGVVQTVARRKDGSELELTLTFVPVGMSQSLEFNGFLEALEIAAPRGNALRQLQRSHQTVVDWISAAMGGHARLDEDDLAAGTIVAFRPLIELPPAPLPPEEDEPDATADGGRPDRRRRRGRARPLRRPRARARGHHRRARGGARRGRGGARRDRQGRRPHRGARLGARRHPPRARGDARAVRGGARAHPRDRRGGTRARRAAGARAGRHAAGTAASERAARGDARDPRRAARNAREGRGSRGRDRQRARRRARTGSGSRWTCARRAGASSSSRRPLPSRAAQAGDEAAIRQRAWRRCGQRVEALAGELAAGRRCTPERRGRGAQGEARGARGHRARGAALS